MRIVIVPLMPVSSSVPESGTIDTSIAKTPLRIVPLCCRTKLPRLPLRAPVTSSSATYARLPAGLAPAAPRRSHPPPAARLQVPVELLGQEAPAERTPRRVILRLRGDRDFECPAGGHRLFFLNIRAGAERDLCAEARN